MILVDVFAYGLRLVACPYVFARVRGRGGQSRAVYGYHQPLFVLS